MSLLGGILSVGGSLLGLSGRNEQREADARYYNHLADAKEMQAEFTLEAAREQSENIIAQASRQNKILQQNIKKTMASQKAAIAASGIGAGSSLAQTLSESSTLKGLEDEAALRYNADLSVKGVRKQAYYNAAALRQEAKGYRMAAKSGGKAGAYDTAGTLLGIGAQVADRWI